VEKEFYIFRILSKGLSSNVQQGSPSDDGILVLTFLGDFEFFVDFDFLSFLAKVPVDASIAVMKSSIMKIDRYFFII